MRLGDGLHLQEGPGTVARGRGQLLGAVVPAGRADQAEKARRLGRARHGGIGAAAAVLAIAHRFEELRDGAEQRALARAGVLRAQEGPVLVDDRDGDGFGPRLAEDAAAPRRHAGGDHRQRRALQRMAVDRERGPLRLRLAEDLVERRQAVGAGAAARAAPVLQHVQLVADLQHVARAGATLALDVVCEIAEHFPHAGRDRLGAAGTETAHRDAQARIAVRQRQEVAQASQQALHAGMPRADQLAPAVACHGLDVEHEVLAQRAVAEGVDAAADALQPLFAREAHRIRGDVHEHQQVRDPRGARERLVARCHVGMIAQHVLAQFTQHALHLAGAQAVGALAHRDARALADHPVHEAPAQQFAQAGRLPERAPGGHGAAARDAGPGRPQRRRPVGHAQGADADLVLGDVDRAPRVHGVYLAGLALVGREEPAPEDVELARLDGASRIAAARELRQEAVARGELLHQFVALGLDVLDLPVRARVEQRELVPVPAPLGDQAFHQQPLPRGLACSRGLRQLLARLVVQATAHDLQARWLLARQQVTLDAPVDHHVGVELVDVI